MYLFNARVKGAHKSDPKPRSREAEKQRNHRTIVTCYFHYTLISVPMRVFRPTCIGYTRGRLPEVSMPFLGSHFAEKIFWQRAQRKKQTIYQRYLEEEKNVLGVYRREKHECWGPRGRNKQCIRGIRRKKKCFSVYKNMNVGEPRGRNKQ